jgi:hypothetical protein
LYGSQKVVVIDYGKFGRPLPALIRRAYQQWKTLPFPRGSRLSDPPLRLDDACPSAYEAASGGGPPHRYPIASPSHKSSAIFLLPPDISHTAMDTTTISLPMRWIFARRPHPRQESFATTAALLAQRHHHRPPSPPSHPRAGCC